VAARGGTLNIVVKRMQLSEGDMDLEARWEQDVRRRR